jgi:hypothetical protein
MAYIGKQPVIGNFVKLDAISVVNGQASYTMQNVSGSTITFASNLVTGDVIDFIIVLGNTLDVGVPSDNTVSLAKLTATGTKDATTFLRGDNTFAEAGGGGKVLQVVSATDSTVRSTTSTSYVTASNTLSVAITPSSTSSKILLMLDTPVFSNAGGSEKTYVTIFKDGSDLNSANSYGLGALGVYTPANTGGYIYGTVGISHINSPSTTSSVTYDVRFRVEASSFTGYINQSGDGAGISTLTAIEIGA